MLVPPLRLQHRIIVPFALVALVATGATAYVALSVTTRTLESRVEAQVLNAAALVNQSDFSLNPAILRSVKAIAGADVITYAGDGRILASTVDGYRSAALHAAITSPPVTRDVLAGAAGADAIRRVDCDGPCAVAYRRVSSRPDTVVAVVAILTDLMTATRTVTRTIIAAAGLSLVAMILVGQAVARRVTRPLDDLVRFTHDVQGGDARRRAPAGADEIGRLAVAFNDMLDRLERSREALVRSEKLALAGLFAARVAHDIRNPLSSMKMRAQLLQSRPGGDADSATLLAAVLRDIDQVEAVIHGLIELARPGELTCRPASVNEIVRGALHHLAPQFAHRRITAVTDLDAGLPPLPLDADRFALALTNLLVNAAEAMPTGGTLTVSTAAATGGSTMFLDVCDDGTGIDPEITGRLFDPFVSTKRDGVGLGLVNVKAVVVSHGGSIAFEANQPKGTRARITLPMPGVVGAAGRDEADG